jgi:hypothetical protein
MAIETAHVVPEYKFHTGFLAPAADFASAEMVQASLGAQLGIPEEHNFAVLELPPVQDQAPRLHRYLGRVSFIDWHAENPDAWQAEMAIDVLEPGFVARALSRLRLGKPKAEVGARGFGREPFGGGENAETMPDKPLPMGPRGDLAHV